MDREQLFWDWFKQNETQYFFLNHIDNDTEKDKLLNDLLDHLHQYCSHLYFVVGGHPDGKQDLIITAEGDTDFFKQVDNLVNNAPNLEHWNIIAFKPVQKDFKTNYKDLEMNPQDMYFIPLSSDKSNQIGLRIYVADYDSTCNTDVLTAVYLVLDNILGEKSSALDIGYVEIEALQLNTAREELIELVKLPRYIKWKKSNSAAQS